MSSHPRTLPAAPPLRFPGVSGRVLAHLLQVPAVRYHRVQLGFVEFPREYEQFLHDVVAPRLAALPAPLGVFGLGAHTDLVCRVLPDLARGVHCFTDNDPAQWRRRRDGRPIVPPPAAVSECAAFFLSTAVFQRVLSGDLRRLGFTGPIVAMDDVVPPHWFLGSAA